LIEDSSSLSIDENFISKFNVYPNPTIGLLNINSKSQISKLEIYNITGQLVISEFNKDFINVFSLSSGLYFIKIEDIFGSSETIKFIKE